MSEATRREEVARHEAGHCVLVVLFGATVGEVNIVPNNERDGYCAYQGIFRASGSDRAKLNRAIQVCLAGLAAQRRFNRRARRADARDDYDYALGACRYIAAGRRAHAPI